MHTNVNHICITDLCPFAGVITIWPDNGHIGTFCNDGSFTFPIGQAMKAGKGRIVFVQYHIPVLADVMFSFKYKEEHFEELSKVINTMNPLASSTNNIMFLSAKQYIHWQITMFHDYRYMMGHKFLLNIANGSKGGMWHASP